MVIIKKRLEDGGVRRVRVWQGMDSNPFSDLSVCVSVRVRG